MREYFWENLYLGLLNFLPHIQEIVWPKKVFQGQAYAGLFILHWSERAKKILSICIWVERQCVCLSWRKSWITFDGMKGFWWNFQDHFNSVLVMFGLGSQISWPLGYKPYTKNCLFLENLSPLSFCPTGVWHTLFGNLRTWVKKEWGAELWILG